MPANLINKFDELVDLVTNNPIISSAVAVGGIAVCGMLGYCLWSRRKSSQRLHPLQKESLIIRHGTTGTGYYAKIGANPTSLRQHDSKKHSKKQDTTAAKRTFSLASPPCLAGAHHHEDDTCLRNVV